MLDIVGSPRYPGKTLKYDVRAFISSVIPGQTEATNVT